MLYLESAVTYEGITFFRDFSDPKLYYYLPKDVKIGKNEEALHFTIFTDKTILESEKPDLDVKQIGGFINLESVLGPDQDDLNAAISKLKDAVGADDIRTTPVPFEKGEVSLAILGKSSDAGKDDKNEMEIEIVGAGKPCLTGNHQSAFNMKVGDKAAQIVYDLLNNTPQTQMTVFYSMDYLGVIPAYNLDIIVDFKATEKYINNNIDLNFDLEEKSKNLKVLVEADIDSVIQDLVNEGTIEIKETDYTEEHRFNKGVSSQVDLIKTLIGTELFNPTIMPNSPNTVLKDTVNQAGDNKQGSQKDGKDAKDGKDGKDTNGGKDVKDANNGKDGKDAKGKEEGGAKPTPDKKTDATPAGDKKPEDKKPEDKKPEDKKTEDKKSEEKNPNASKPAEGEKLANVEKSTDAAKAAKDGEKSAEDGEKSDEGGEKPAEDGKDEKKKSDLYISAKLGYTLRHRKLEEQVKRTFHFNRNEVKRLPFALSGILSTTDSKFNPQKQVHFVNLGTDEFHNTKLSFSSNTDLESYGITKAKVEWRLEDMKEWNSILFDKDQTSYKRELIHNDAQYPNLIYKASFATNDFGVVNTEEITTEERDVFVVPDRLEDKQFLRVRAGSLENISNIIVKVLPDGKEELMKSCCLSSDKPSCPMMIDKCKSYDVVVEYPQSTGQPQRVTYREQTGTDFMVYSPHSIQVRTLRGKGTFTDGVAAVEVTLTYNGGQEKQILLTEDELTGTYVFNYEIIGKEKNDEETDKVKEKPIKVTYTVYREDGDEEVVDAGDFTQDTAKIALKIFKKSNATQEEKKEDE